MMRQDIILTINSIRPYKRPMDPRFDDPCFCNAPSANSPRVLQPWRARSTAPGARRPGHSRSAPAVAGRRLPAPLHAGGFHGGRPGGHPRRRQRSAWARYQRATARAAELGPRSRWRRAGAVADALAQRDPQAPPITSLRELHAPLSIECGEAAYGEAARREEFAAAQAELVMALVELRAVQA